MSRSVKKGPYVEARLLKRVEEMNNKGEKKVLKLRFNSRRNVVFPVPAFPVRNTFTPVYSKKSYANSS